MRDHRKGAGTLGKEILREGKSAEKGPLGKCTGGQGKGNRGKIVKISGKRRSLGRHEKGGEEFREGKGNIVVVGVGGERAKQRTNRARGKQPRKREPPTLDGHHRKVSCFGGVTKFWKRSA